jgi:sigma-E factor negative regulatory protein RseA
VLAPRRRATAKRVNAYVLSAAASLSAVALVVWVAFSINLNPLSTPPQVVAKARIPAASPVPATAQVASISNLSDFSSQGNLNEYLLAHQGFSPSTAILGVAPYIRSVSDSQPLPNRR